MINIENKANFEEYIYLLTVILSVFFIGSNYAFITIIVLLSLLLILILKQIRTFKIPKAILIFVGYLCLISFQSIIIPSKYFDLQVAIKELQRILIYILIILIVHNTSVKEKRFIKLWNTIFIISLFISILQFYKLLGINNILESLYGSSIFLEIASKYTTLKNFRAGSIFINPNSYAKFIVSYLSLYITVSYRTNKKSKKVTMAFLILLALILAGSRTGLVLSIIILLNKVIQKIKQRKLLIKKYYMLLIPIVLFTIIFSILYITSSNIIDIENIRIIKVLAGVSNSISYKFSTFTSILDDFNILNVFIGLGPFKNDLWGITLIDFDFGYQIAYYGLAGLIFYMLMIRDFYVNSKRKEFDYKLFYKSLTIVFILFGFTGGIFFNLSFFSMFITLMYTNITD